MKCKTFFWWLYVAFALLALYLFCTVTCAPVAKNSVAHVHDAFCACWLAVAAVVCIIRRFKNPLYNKRQTLR